MARQKNKTDTIGVRVSPRLRFALDLLARKHGASLSTIMVMAAEKLIESEGLTTVPPEEEKSLLDKLWSESESERLLALLKHAPTLLTHPERTMAEVLEYISFTRDYEKYEDEEAMQIPRGQRLAYRIWDHSLAPYLLSPVVNDVFADDLLKIGGEFENTVELKNAVRALVEKEGPIHQRNRDHQ